MHKIAQVFPKIFRNQLALPQWHSCHLWGHPHLGRSGIPRHPAWSGHGFIRWAQARGMSWFDGNWMWFFDHWNYICMLHAHVLVNILQCKNARLLVGIPRTSACLWSWKTCGTTHFAKKMWLVLHSERHASKGQRGPLTTLRKPNKQNNIESNEESLAILDTQNGQQVGDFHDTMAIHGLSSAIARDDHCVAHLRPTLSHLSPGNAAKMFGLFHGFYRLRTGTTGLCWSLQNLGIYPWGCFLTYVYI